MSWGTKIVISFAVFMIGMIGMVVYVFNLQMDLVEDNYYEKEIKYQDQIDILTATQNLKAELKIDQASHSISFDFPKEGSLPTGEIHFYRPSDAKSDFKVDIATDDERKQTIPTEKLIAGVWEVQVTWYSDNQKYFKEERIFID